MIQRKYGAEDISIVIPTYGRERILIETIEHLLALSPLPGCVLIVDQTATHETSTRQSLERWHNDGRIRWIHRRRPSIPAAMNAGLLQSKTDWVLYMDDDIIPKRDLIAAYARTITEMKDERLWCVAGQVLQPGEEEIPFDSWKHKWFPFNSDRRQYISDCMAGNLCVHRPSAVAIGGFDENFVAVAHRFESEFARRVVRSGGKILYEPKASMRHLREGQGGTRSYGELLTTWKPSHAVGKYYFGFSDGPWETVKTLAYQPFRAIRTRHHLARPWYVPVSLAAEILGILWALKLKARGPRHIDRHDAAG